MVEALSTVTYRIRRGPRGKPKVVHVDRLWRYYGPGRFTWVQGDDDADEDVDGDGDLSGLAQVFEEADSSEVEEHPEENLRDEDVREENEDDMSSPGTSHPRRTIRRPGRYVDFVLD